MATVCLIPARLGSTRLPNKPLADLGGKPMIVRVYAAAASTGLFDMVVVATDSKEVAEAVRKPGGDALMTSPTHTSGTDRIAEAAGTLKLDRDDLIINLQGDEPLVAKEVLAALVIPMRDDPSINMGTLAYPLSGPEDIASPDVVKVVSDLRGHALYFSRLPIPFLRDEETGSVHLKHLGIYGYRLHFLRLITATKPTGLERAEGLEQLRVLEAGHRIRVFMSPADTIGVDTPEDLEEVRRMISRDG